MSHKDQSKPGVSTETVEPRRDSSQSTGMGVADALAMLVSGRWIAGVRVWNLRLGKFDLNVWPDDGAFKARLQSTTDPNQHPWVPSFALRLVDATGATEVAALRALLSGPDAALVIGILSYLKALPWLPEPDPELGMWWWRLIGGVALLEAVTRKPTRRFPGGELHIDGAPISGLLGGPWKWMLAVPPPTPPEAA